MPTGCQALYKVRSSNLHTNPTSWVLVLFPKNGSAPSSNKEEAELDSEFPMVRHLGALAMETQQWVAIGATREWGSNGPAVELGMAKSGVWTCKPTRLPGNLATKEPGLSCSEGVGLRPIHR